MGNGYEFTVRIAMPLRKERISMKNIYKNLEVQFNKLFRHINVGSFKTREWYGKAFTEKRITFHRLRHTYAHEKYDEYINKGYSEYQARKKVSKLLGHHRDEVTRIYLAEGDDYA